jgi:hypothetical protein
MALQVLRTVVAAGVAYVAWLFFWAYPDVATGLGAAFHLLNHSGTLPPESVWHQLGRFGQWVYATAALLAILAALLKRPLAPFFSALWFLSALFLALAGLAAFSGGFPLQAGISLAAVMLTALWLATAGTVRAA